MCPFFIKQGDTVLQNETDAGSTEYIDGLLIDSHKNAW
jgi:hypothetical protein